MWAIGTFQSFKSAVPDGIIPALLQETLETILPRLNDILSASMVWSYIPKLCREVRVEFIPEAGQINQNTIKDYGYVSKSSCSLKPLEILLLDVNVRENITRENFSGTQHA